MEELKRVRDGRPILARPVGSVERFRRWCKRNPVIASLSGLLALALVVGLAGVTWQWRRAEQNAADEQTARRDAEQARQQAESESERARQSAIAERAARRGTRRRLYMAHMNLIGDAWSSGNVERIRELLEPWKTSGPDEADLRGFEWYYWLWYANRFERGLRHGTSVNGVDVSPDGKFAATMGAQGSVKLWDVESGEVHWNLVGLNKSVDAGAFSPDGVHFAAGGSRPAGLPVERAGRAARANVFRTEQGRRRESPFRTTAKNWRLARKAERSTRGPLHRRSIICRFAKVVCR